MFLRSCKSIWLYFRLCFSIKQYYDFYKSHNNHNSDLLDRITLRIIDCGAIAIKFCQWVTPKLELIYLERTDIQKDIKPEWLSQLEQFYEKCPEHTSDYTKIIYNQEFNENFDEIYQINEIIGSGSIGQVYLVTNKKSKRKEVIKILHPNVREQINFFKKFLQLILWIPCISKKIHRVFPFDIIQFIYDFEIQTNLMNEANHLLYFYEEYKNNEFIIIPKLFKMSPSILIMSYEHGLSFSESKMNEYQKDKMINLYHLFIRNNQMLQNYNHGDLHPGNWKIREETNNKHKLIIYDFGYCWKLPISLFNEMGTIFIDTFEESNTNSTTDCDNLCKLMYFSILYDKDDKETGYKHRIKEHVTKELNNNEVFDVIISLKGTIKFCIEENCKLNPILIQCYILFIQGQKLFEKYGLQSSTDNVISDYDVYREKYLNILTLCKTYSIFQEHSVYIENKLNKVNPEVTGLFDTIDFDDEFKKLALN